MRKLLILIGMATLLLLAATLALPAAAAPNVCRDLPTGDQAAGAEITISLAVTDVNGVNWNLVDETIPSGLTVVDAGGASTETPGHLKWSTTSSSPDVTYTYTVTGSAGTYTFGGVYLVSGGDETPINCDTGLVIGGESHNGDAVTPTTSTATTTGTGTQPVSEENVTPTPAITETNTRPVSGETVTPATPTSTITETNTSVTTPTKKLATKPGTNELPGFEAIFVIAGLLAVAYLISKRE